MTAQPNRKQRRASLAAERTGLKGNWGVWRITYLENGVPGADPDGWCSEITKVYANNLYVVLYRPFLDQSMRPVEHLAIRTASNLEPPWRDLQRIKNEICGPQATAVQVMPPADELVDAADMYHIWAFNEALPFSLYDRRLPKVRIGR